MDFKTKLLSTIAIVIMVCSCMVVTYYSEKNTIQIEAIKAGLVQDANGNWVKPVVQIQGMGYGGSDGHLTPQEVDALYTKPKDKE